PGARSRPRLPRRAHHGRSLGPRRPRRPHPSRTWVPFLACSPSAAAPHTEGTRNMKRRSLGVAVMAAAIAATLAACSTDTDPPQTDAAAGGTVHIGLDIEVTSADPVGNEIGQQPSLVLAHA